MEIEVTIEKNRELLLNSDRYGRIYNGASQYMVEPYRILESFNQPISMIKLGSPTLIEKEEEEAKAYSNYIIESKMMENEIIEGFFGTIGVLVQCSSNKISVYAGANAAACLNLHIWGDFIQVHDLNKSASSLRETLLEAEKSMTDKLNYIKLVKERLEAQRFDTAREFDDYKGNVLSRLPLNLFGYMEHGEGQLRDANSIYHDMPNSAWKLLSCMNDKISKESPTRRLQSTLALEKIFA
jgi:pyoverdine/dityrosine biosynthesis protein Dit1